MIKPLNSKSRCCQARKVVKWEGLKMFSFCSVCGLKLKLEAEVVQKEIEPQRKFFNG